jgi:hypothetical protein
MWRFVVAIAAGVYGCSFIGQYMEQRNITADRNPMTELAELHSATDRQISDYTLFCEGRVSEAVVQADAAEVRRRRTLLASYLR